MTTYCTDLFERVRSHAPSVRRIVDSSHRLDASYYTEGAEDARGSFASSTFRLSAIRDLAKVFALSDFSLMRIPAHRTRGVPFYTVSDILEWTPTPSMYLSTKYERSLDNYIVNDGWILLSRSGTVGNALIVGKDLAGTAIANHAIRILPEDPEIGALIFLLLSGQVGQQIVSSFTYGSVVGEITPAQIELMKIPVPPPSILKVIRKHIDKSLSSRTQANRLHGDAIAELLRTSGLPALPDSDKDLMSGEGSLQVFKTAANAIVPRKGVEAEYRLDAHFYNPRAQRAVANIMKCKCEVKTVGDVSSRVQMGPRFKRNYVESDHGVPFLSGKSIVQIRPRDLKYLSNLQIADMQELILEQGWTLITCSGTIGRTCFVWRNYEDYAGSQHILRVVPNEAEIDPGYLYAFLSSSYGFELILRYRHGSVIDEVTDKQVEQVLVPRPSRKQQQRIGDMVREAYDKRADSIRLEDEAQRILTRELTKSIGSRGV